MPLFLTLFASVLLAWPAAPQQPEKLERNTDAMGATTDDHSRGGLEHGANLGARSR